MGGKESGSLKIWSSLRIDTPVHRSILSVCIWLCSLTSQASVPGEGVGVYPERQTEVSVAAGPASDGKSADRGNDDYAPFTVSAVPTLTYGSDEGFGTGGVGTFYWNDPVVLPYRAALTLNIFVTTRLIQRHRVRLDALRVGGLPLRIFAQVGYESTLTQNFCGYGNEVSCSRGQGVRALQRANVAPDSKAFATGLRKHHQMRFVRPYGEVLMRYALRDKPHRVELWAGWRGNLYLPGQVNWDDAGGELRFEEGAYPHSQWEAYAEKGFSSTFQFGTSLDNRDEEIQPNRGYFIEASIRGNHPLWGSDWAWFGANISASLFTPLHQGTRSEGADWVLAQRWVLDGISGKAPTEDIARLGGLTDFIAVGGSDIGRGIREHRYLGKWKTIVQHELRWSFAEFDLLSQHLKLGWAGFLDAACLGYDWHDWRGAPLGIVWGAGGGFRLLWNRNFSVRFDVGASPAEQYQPRIYIRVGNSF